MIVNLNNMIVLPMLLYFARHTDAGNIFHLNDTEYRKMPALYAMDEYGGCLRERGGVYCVLDLALFAAGASPLMDMIHDYSEVTTKHFNHTQLHRGVCVTETCAPFIGQRNLRNEQDLSAILTACINDTVWRKYSIQARVSSLNSCEREGEAATYDASDFAAVGVILALIVLNSIGTFYDLFKNEDTKGNPYLLSFSLVRNWRKLAAPSGAGPEPRLARLRVFNGLRAMTIVCVIFSHTSLIMTFSFVENPLYIERSYDDVSKQILFNGSLVVCTFFVMSGFLLAFNFELLAEKRAVGWLEVPKGVLLRWLRLTPPYALMLGLVATVMRRLGSGPLWAQVVTSESAACRRYWWSHLLYVNNYVRDDYACMPQSWYLAADTQLFALGLVFCTCARSPRARALALGLLALLALLVPALITYLHDLDATVIQAPETLRSLYKWDATFHRVYIPAHTNLGSYTLGLAGGLLAHRWLSDGKTDQQFRKYRYLVWATFPVGVAVILSGALFYGEARAPLPARVVYAALYKPAFQAIIVFLIVALVFRAEGLYRGILEWRGFAWAGRVSYSAFLVHTPLQRALAGAAVQPAHLTDYCVMVNLCGFLFLTFLFAAILWLCVEAPTKALSSAALAPRPRPARTPPAPARAPGNTTPTYKCHFIH